ASLSSNVTDGLLDDGRQWRRVSGGPLVDGRILAVLAAGNVHHAVTDQRVQFQRPLTGLLPLVVQDRNHDLLATENGATGERRIVQGVEQVRPNQVDGVLHGADTGNI